MIREAIRKSLLACLFLLAAAGAGAQQTGTNRIYVAAAGTGSGNSWEDAAALTQTLLDGAAAGTEIWMRGYADRTVYTVPADGLTVPAGVQLYGGFAGTEERIDDRATEDGIAYRMRYRTVLSGDVDHNDKVDGSNLIFPENTSRKNNATHVLTLNLATGTGSLNSGAATVVNGLTIARGHADGDDEAGGGIYVMANGGTLQVGYRIEQCFFVKNYATRGGALYVDGGVTQPTGAECLVDRCGFFNNAAGSRSALTNEGGAICLDGAGCVVNTAVFNNENGGILIDPDGGSGVRVLNSTVTRNTGSGIDGNGADVVNTVIWGNAALYSASTSSPSFQYCAYPEVVVTDSGEGTDADHNLYLSDKNNDTQGPLFNSPSIRAGFDHDYDVTATLYPLWTWVPQEGSPLIDKGNSVAYPTTDYGDLDLAGNARVAGPEDPARIDIGAFEYQPVLAARIRYVKPAATGTGDGSSWDNASGDLQRMIDELADNNPNDLPGEVWVAAGVYTPQAYLIANEQYSASFRMRDGISVYGGFAGTEASKAERALGGDGNMPWHSKHRTILQGSYYSDENVSYGSNRWSITGDSRHVVWFAPLPGSGEGAFGHVTTLDGVTIKGGYAQGGTGLDNFLTDRGAGVYMDGRNTRLTNCIVTQNNATGAGGGVYLKGGRIQGSLLYNNNAGTDGGAVYVDSTGLVLRSMLANNTAGNGAGAYLAYTADETTGHPEYLILSTCVVTNNTARQNGAVYCDGGGVLLQNTIANNHCPTTTDATDPNASQTGGLYIDEYGLVINSVLWNNRLGSENPDEGTRIPFYVRNASTDDVRFYHNAISSTNNAVWNDVFAQETLVLSETNTATTSGSVGPRFGHGTAGQMANEDALDETIGVQAGWTDGDNTGAGISYYWQPVKGSNLWARGMELGQLPDEVVLAPEVDLGGTLFAQRPAIGAHHVDGTLIVPEREGTTLRLYVDASSTNPANDGRSWAKAYRSLNDAIRFFAELTEGSTLTVVEGGKENTSFEYDGQSVTAFEILVLEGNLWPRYAYVNDDPKTATLDILPMPGEQTLRIEGGYAYRNTTPQDAFRDDPLNHRSQLNGNNGGQTLADGIYHVVTVESGAKVTLDGFHIINGYAAGSATLQYGAGMLVHNGAEVTVENCIFENNKAADGAAIYAKEAERLTLRNCVVNNNTNTTEENSVIVGPDNFTLNHVTIVNNVGAAPANLGTSSFALGNSSGNSQNLGVDIPTTGADGAAHFANPTNDVGATTLGFDTYLGGYSEFRPLTSSEEAAALINQSTGTPAYLTQDITCNNARNLGGVPDLGAYEADLPEAGRIIYVRVNGSGDGLSWGNAMGDINDAVQKALDYNANLSPEDLNDADKRAQVWVAAGTYTHTSSNDNGGESNKRVHDQYYAYKMEDGVSVYGGFRSSGTPGFDDRHPRTYQTILQPGDTDPSIRVEARDVSFGRVLVQADDFNRETVWDGFTLQNGYLFSCYRQNIVGDISQVETNRVGSSGGAGAYLMRNGVLENCIIKRNIVFVDPNPGYDMDETGSGDGGYHQAGAGIYNTGGTIRNCQILENELQHALYRRSDNGIIESAWMYGAGIYMNDGTVFNTVIAKNTAKIIKGNIELDERGNQNHQVIVGAGAFLVRGNFYNNTIVENVSRTYNPAVKNISLSGVYVYDGMVMFNCIISENTDLIENAGTTQIYGYPIAAFDIQGTGLNAEYNPDATKVEVHYSCVKIVDDSKNLARYNDGENTNKYSDPFLETNYQLGIGSVCINSGTENVGYGVDIPDYDADYTDRIKDCAIDMGAFELDNTENIKYESENEGTEYVYYVSQNGNGTRSGAGADDAACAMKLQDVLTKAGEVAKDNGGKEVIVKVAGYEGADGFVYHANTLSDENSPQSYTFVVPEGVTLMGGYNENDWTERNAIAYRTVLSAITDPTEAGTTITQEVNGYHTVTFGAWPGTADLTEAAILDGVWLTDGSATSLAGTGNANTRGGGAIVPKEAHVRNCVVTGNTAVDGGGLYVLPGGRVSGTLVYGNEATGNGGGIYADNDGVDNAETAEDNNRAHLFSNTIAENTADEGGGGLYLEDGAAMTVNSVIWGNTAGTGKDVSGVSNKMFGDNLLSEIDETMTGGWYPFNNCFVQETEFPGNFENSSMTGESGTYFADDYRLKAYSPLVNHGMVETVQTTLEADGHPFGLAASDMAGTDRTEGMEKIDVGAFARLGAMPTDLVTRLFVAQGSNAVLAEGTNEEAYIGRSFYTPFTWLEDALDYIGQMRSKGSGHTEEARNATFEILVAQGTYKPNYRRTDNGSKADNSFVIPYGVRIYGGFTGEEDYKSDNTGWTTIPGVDNVSFRYEDIDGILDNRGYSDFNQNHIDEAWELAAQTLFSGELNGTTGNVNAHHVFYTVADNTAPTDMDKTVVLDGVTVMGGATETSLSAVTDDAADLAEGRGGGIYSNGVPYTIVRSRLLSNQAVRGGAVFVKDADLRIVNSILAGNRTVANKGTTSETLASRGGAVYVAGNNTATTLYAVNTLWANNESAKEGGAIGTNYATGTEGSSADPQVNLMNNTFVRNKAATNPVLYNHNAKSVMTNTLIWGNDGPHNDITDLTDVGNIEVYHSASDVNYDEKFAAGNGYNNLLLSTHNMDTNGPRFTSPATVAGAAGNDADNRWNPASTSLVTDAGDGVIPYTDGAEGTVDGAYTDWMTANAPAYANDYMGDAGYERYSGPRDGNNMQLDKVIDIGVYEYQYVSNFSTMTAIYVDTLGSGLKNGDSWANATDDLRGAIIGAANPTDKNGGRVVYVRDGEYSWNRISGGTAFPLSMSSSDLSKKFTLKGSCTGNDDQQDYSKPSVITNADATTGGSTTQLMSINANNKSVVIDGFTFINEVGSGITASTNAGSGDNNPAGSLTLTHTAFRQNDGTGVVLSENNGKVLIVNSLFADGGTGFASNGTATLVNTTFANNATDMTIGKGSTTSVYNSVSWNNGNQKNSPMPKDEAYSNKVFTTYYTLDEDARENNEDITNGPNFVDPMNEKEALRDYRIRPSLTLLNQGSNVNYLKEALDDEDAVDETPFPENERDLYDVSRKVDGRIDIGAYEYEAPLQPIIYVKAGLTVTERDGRTWETALEDLQSAVDLAGIYAHTRNEESGSEENGYVFVHSNVSSADLRVTLDSTKVYGGMNDETSSSVVYDPENDGIHVEYVRPAVTELLGKRDGLLEGTNRSTLDGVSVSAASVVDGFEVGGTATLSKGGYLSTSVVGSEETSGSVTGESSGILYNTLVYGDVSDVQSVNVTATREINEASDYANNRASVPNDSLNRYVEGLYWDYQLNEYSPDMDVQLDVDTAARAKATRDCIARVGHKRDIAGNLRIRNAVDNGCFETWNVVDDMTASADDYPHGKSVVYVRADKELILGKNAAGDAPYYGTDNRFNPGFLLLEYRAGLRGNGNHVGLTHFAVERNLGSDGTDFAAIPFEIVDNDLLYNIVDATDVTVQTYNGWTRAAYDYQFAPAESKAWEDADVTTIVPGPVYTGFAVQGNPNTKVRFYGTSYSETPTAKDVGLEQYNYREPWSSGDESGNRFTHKENMGWNLFGSPYLCAMNYGDMEYGRVLYGLTGDGATASYTTVLTYNNETGASVLGHIPAGDAVFTQTATLQEWETFSVEQPKIGENNSTKSGTAYSVQTLSLYLASASAEATTRSAATTTESDRVLLNAVPAEQSISDFDLGIDGVKWMAADGKPQIFAVRGAGRYSLLGALDVEGTTTVGVTTAGAGFYEIGIPDDCPAEGYETVRLRDRKTGAEADLLQEPYVFSAVAGEDCTERFEVSFCAAADELLPGAGMRASVDETGLLRVGNLPEGTTRVTLYDAEGRAVAAAGCAGRPEADFRLTAHGVYVVQADGGARVKIVW